MNDTQTYKITLYILRILGVILSVIGYFFAAVFVIVLFGGQINDAGSVAAGLIVLGLAITGIVSGHKVKKMIIRFKKYISITDELAVIPLDSLAEITQQSIEQVKKDISALTKMGIYKNAFLDERYNYLYPHGYIEVAEDFEAASDESSEIIVVSCKNCGANNNIPKGKESKCEYCGSALSE